MNKAGRQQPVLRLVGGREPEWVRRARTYTLPSMAVGGVPISDIAIADAGQPPRRGSRVSADATQPAVRRGLSA